MELNMSELVAYIVGETNIAEEQVIMYLESEYKYMEKMDIEVEQQIAAGEMVEESVIECEKMFNFISQDIGFERDTIEAIDEAEMQYMLENGFAE